MSSTSNISRQSSASKQSTTTSQPSPSSSTPTSSSTVSTSQSKSSESATNAAANKDQIPTNNPSFIHSQTVAKDKFNSVLDEIIDNFVIKLKRRELRGSGLVAIQTAELLRTVISKKKFNSVSEIINLIRSIGRTLTNAHYIELSIGNIVRRVLFIIRHEAAAIQQQAAKLLEEKDNNNNSNINNSSTNNDSNTSEEADNSQQSANVDLSLSLHKLFDQQQLIDNSNNNNNSNNNANYFAHSTDSIHLDNKQLLKLKPAVIEEIGELMEEIRGAQVIIAEQAIEHIYAKEVILTFGMSRTVIAFLLEAAKIRKFEVVVAESAPSFQGQRMARILAESGIETTVITDSSIFAIMPSINKVIIGTHSVMANGGLIAHTGSSNIAIAAKYHNVPFVVLTGLHKLSPLYSFDQDTFNEHNNPSQLLKYEYNYIDNVNVENPSYDYITPDLITLFITNDRGHNPSYIYRLLAEYYNPADYQL